MAEMSTLYVWDMARLGGIGYRLPATTRGLLWGLVDVWSACALDGVLHRALTRPRWLHSGHEMRYLKLETWARIVPRC